MTGAESLNNVTVVFASLICVLNQQRNGRACGEALINTRQNLNRIGFIALGYKFRSAWPPAVEVGLDVCFRQRHAGWAPVNYAADGWAVGFTKVGDRKKGAEGVAAHRHPLSQREGASFESFSLPSGQSRI